MTISTYGIIFLGLFIGVAISSFLFIYYLNFFDPYYKLLRKRVFNNKRSLLFEGSNTEQIQAMASDRRKKIADFLNNGSEFDTSGGSNSYQRRPRFPFIELVPGRDQSNVFEFGGPRPNYDSQRILLEYQLKSDEDLLAQRLVDAMIMLYGSRSIWSYNFFEFPVVKIEAISKTAKRTSEFPWMLVIETDDRKFWEKSLSPLKEWLAIRIEIGDKIPVNLYARCIHKGGKTGVTGGILNNNLHEFRMTCNHVLASYCPSRSDVYDPEVNEFSPDAVLLDADTPCLPLEDNLTDVLPIASRDDLKRFLSTRHYAKKLKPGKQTPIGVIKARVIDFEMGGRLQRFPHVQIDTRFVKKFGLLFPMFDRRFSKPGESGTWVVEQTSGLFIGMVVAGDELNTISYILESEPLLEHFQEELSNHQLVFKTIKT